MKVNGGTHPSLETIGAFVDGRFKDRERDTIAEHLASCEECYFVFSEAARTKVSAQPAAEVGTFVPRRLTWRIAAGLAAAASILLAVNFYVVSGVDRDAEALTELVAAVGPTRTFDGRLSGGFVYGPVRGPVRGPADPEPLPPDARIAIARIEKEYGARPVAGAAALIAGDAARAVSILESASQQDPNNARILSDLSASYLQSGDASRALAAANRALEQDRLLPEALFNRALALEASGLRDEAKTAWQSFLTIDDRSGWADEARTRLRILSNQP
jgi:tetratricopeptide (TPR) repeat protein